MSFLEKFLAGDIPAAEFHHADHVRAGYELLRTMDFLDAVSAYGRALKIMTARVGKPVPGVAPAAVQSGRHVVKNILATIRGEERRPFHYTDKGSLATIGRARAVADLGFASLSGFIAWLAWLVIHIALLIGFKNRFVVLIQWAWSYLAFDRGSRLIHGMVSPKRVDAPELPSSKRGAALHEAIRVAQEGLHAAAAAAAAKPPVKKKLKKRTAPEA